MVILALPKSVTAIDTDEEKYGACSVHSRYYMVICRNSVHAMLYDD